MGQPIINAVYEKNGFVFRVDFVEDGQVYVARWRAEHYNPAYADDGNGGMEGFWTAEKSRIDIERWNEEMAGAKVVSMPKVEAPAMPPETLFPATTSTSAVISLCGRYRYSLTRTWDTRRTVSFSASTSWRTGRSSSKPVVSWLMLNPSTANAFDDDPTIRRCINFSRAWGAGGIVVVNLFALRATNPRALYADPVGAIGPDNDTFIREVTAGRRIVAAWGVHGTLAGRDRAVMKLLKGRRVECLGVTNGGNPKHPLYVRGDTVLQEFKGTDLAHQFHNFPEF